jgi:hypothetical protein
VFFWSNFTLINYSLQCTVIPSGLDTAARSDLEEEAAADEEDRRKEEAATSPRRASSPDLDTTAMLPPEG